MRYLSNTNIGIKILKDDTQKMVCQSNVCPGYDALTSNLRVYPTTMSAIIKSRQETFVDDGTVSTNDSTITDDKIYQVVVPMPIIETSDLVGRSFFINTSKDNQRLYLKIVKALETYQDKLKR